MAESARSAAFLERLLDLYRAQFDIEQNAEKLGERFDGYCRYAYEREKYVLLRKAKLWGMRNFEHVFIRIVPRLTAGDVSAMGSFLSERAEPELVRGGGKYPTVEDHMFTALTGVFISEAPPEPAALEELSKWQFEKSYLFSLKGYSQGRMAAADLEDRTVTASKAGRELKASLEKLLAGQS